MHLKMYIFINEHIIHMRRQSPHPAQSSTSHSLCKKMNSSGAPNTYPLSFTELPSSGNMESLSGLPFIAGMTSEGSAMMMMILAKWTMAIAAQF